MKRLFILSGLLLFSALSSVHAQEVDGSEINRKLVEREERVNKLSIEDQLKLRAAQQKAAQDPDVQAAMAKRDQAFNEFRAAVRASMIKADPSVAAILEKVAIKD